MSKRSTAQAPVGDVSVIQRILDQGYIDAPTAAKKVGRHIITIYRWINDGELEGMMVFGRHFISKRSLVRKVGKRAAVIGGLVTQAEVDEMGDGA